MAVGRIASLHHQVEDHAGPAGGQIELVAVFDVATWLGRCVLGALSAPAVAGLGISGMIQDT
ncbi:hypothetical protein ATB98_01520 [Sinorhizobium saheli]|uniref:Uncharacterized protein n=1 Tax=Sinorhizobium saheli TaxID=36856 RepID=A0A178XI77_SINSA|nr:hypothetical protein ATB98_01520 [Sinorhizobium saheli]